MSNPEATADEGKFNEFLNPKSMLTPGLCGALIMTITNALGTSFNVVGIGRTFISLGLSFLLGSLVFAAQLKSIWQKFVLYLLNSFVIFSMAAGTNSATQAALGSTPSSTESAAPSNLHTQVVEHVTTNVHVVANVGHIRLVSTNYSTNVLPRAVVAPQRIKPQFFERWH
jgi:hypothetical protein